MYNQFKANYYTANPTDYQGPQSGLINSARGSDPQIRGKRDSIINLRRKERLKNNLCQALGQEVNLIMHQFENRIKI